LKINRIDNINDKIKKEDFDTSKNIRKFKKAVRKINKLKKLYDVIDKETKEDRYKKCFCTCRFVILFFVFSIALVTDFLLPIMLNVNGDSPKPTKEKLGKFDSIWGLILAIILSYPLSLCASSYTVIMIYSNKRKNYISGDYLYDKQINDNKSLLKTVQIICGYSFSILYCNIYFWRTRDTNGYFGNPKFYDTIFIPDYTLIRGVTIFMIAKIVLIVSSIIGSYCCYSWKIYKNDLGEFDRNGNFSIYDNPNELDRIKNKKYQVVDVLTRNK